MATKSPLKPEILQQAIAVAMASDSPKRMGAVLLKKRRIVASATNSYEKTHPVQAWYAEKTAQILNQPSLSKKVYLHSEVLCLIKCREDADTIIVCRVGGHNKSNELRMARPCPVCSHYLKKEGIQHVHYSTPNGFMYEYWGD